MYAELPGFFDRGVVDDLNVGLVTDLECLWVEFVGVEVELLFAAVVVLAKDVEALANDGRIHIVAQALLGIELDVYRIGGIEVGRDALDVAVFTLTLGKVVMVTVKGTDELPEPLANVKRGTPLDVLG